jgi:pyridoxamine 5'-phosphate oxidase
MKTPEPIGSMRRNYLRNELLESTISKNPFEQFQSWFEEAKNSTILEANAMTLSTVTKDGRPSSRVVLLKDIREDGYSFYTNYNSKKGLEIANNPFGSLLFFWDVLEKQVRIDGKIQKLSREEAQIYFNSRPFESKIGAWASNQSESIPNRDFIENKYSDLLEKFKGKEVPMPEYWGGYKLIPDSFEFWQGRPSRLHDRIEYRLVESSWVISRLSP